MAYDEFLADRICRQLKERHIPFQDKKMFGGLCFLVDEKMCIGIVENELMARIGPEIEANLEADGTWRPMDFTGRPMKGYVFVSGNGIDREEQLSLWIDRCLAFNPLAKSSKKAKKKA